MGSSVPPPCIIDDDDDDDGATYCLSVDDFFVSDIDKLADDQHISCGRIAVEWTNSMREYETYICPCFDYLDFHPLIDAGFRAACVDYMVLSAEYFGFENQTLHLAVSCLDMYMSNTSDVGARRLFVVSATCLWLAIKHDEEVMEVPSVESIAQVAGNWTPVTPMEILDMEIVVLTAVGYQVWAPTRDAFLSRYLSAASVGMAEEVFPMVANMAEYICEASLGCYEMLAFPASKVAAAAILLAKFILVKRRVTWTATLERYTEYSSCQLKDCATALHRFCIQHRAVVEGTVWKYSTPERDFVAMWQFPATLPSDIFRIW